MIASDERTIGRTARRCSLALALAFTVAGCAASGAEPADLAPETYSAWDMDANRCLDRTEFGANWGAEFGVWDDDDDGFVETDEWGVEVGLESDDFGAFGDWDVNDDGLLDTNEFRDGSFGVFDDDDDDCVEETEWNDDIGIWD